MPKFIPGIGVINPGDERALGTYVYRLRNKKTNEWRRDSPPSGWVKDPSYANVYRWIDVLSMRLFNNDEWVPIGRMLYEIGQIYENQPRPLYTYSRG